MVAKVLEVAQEVAKVLAVVPKVAKAQEVQQALLAEVLVSSKIGRKILAVLHCEL